MTLMLASCCSTAKLSGWVGVGVLDEGGITGGNVGEVLRCCQAAAAWLLLAALEKTASVALILLLALGKVLLLELLLMPLDFVVDVFEDEVLPVRACAIGWKPKEIISSKAIHKFINGFIIFPLQGALCFLLIFSRTLSSSFFRVTQ